MSGQIYALIALTLKCPVRRNPWLHPAKFTGEASHVVGAFTLGVQCCTTIFLQSPAGKVRLDFQCSCCSCIEHWPCIALATVSCLSASMYLKLEGWRRKKSDQCNGNLQFPAVPGGETSSFRLGLGMNSICTLPRLSRRSSQEKYQQFH